MTAPANPLAVMRSRAYVRLLVLAVVLGVPISAFAFGFLKLTSLGAAVDVPDLPRALGYSTPPAWWPLVPSALAGLAGRPDRPLPAGARRRGADARVRRRRPPGAGQPAGRLPAPPSPASGSVRWSDPRCR